MYFNKLGADKMVGNVVKRLPDERG
jgi:hypothetical protein